MAISRVGEVILALCVVGACVFVYQEGARKVQEDPRLVSWARGISPKAHPPPLMGAAREEVARAGLESVSKAMVSKSIHYAGAATSNKKRLA